MRKSFFNGRPKVPIRDADRLNRQRPDVWEICRVLKKEVGKSFEHVPWSNGDDGYVSCSEKELMVEGTHAWCYGHPGAVVVHEQTSCTASVNQLTMLVDVKI
jgi:hypothetical protein